MIFLPAGPTIRAHFHIATIAPCAANLITQTRQRDPSQQFFLRSQVSVKPEDFRRSGASQGNASRRGSLAAGNRVRKSVLPNDGAA